MKFLLLFALPFVASMLGLEEDENDESDVTLLDQFEDRYLSVHAEAVSSFEGTGQIVSDDMFGTNAIFAVNTDAGVPNETFVEALDVFDVENLRFPAGQAEGQDWQVEGQDWVDITVLSDDGTLRVKLTNFLDSVDGSVTLTIPTTNAPLDGYRKHFAQWAQTVMEQYGDKIDAIEIGNEYWTHMDEVEYGQKANIAVSAIANGIEAAEGADADILVQMASPNAQSAFGNSVDSRSYGVRTEEANQIIIDQFDEAAKSEIDGVVEHYYWSQSADPFDDNNAEVNFMNVDIAVWDANFDQELDFHITEWNLRTSTDDTNGMQGVGILVEMVENMVELGVDSANVWPIVHNSTVDLGEPADSGEVRTDDDGRVIHTVRGAVFDLMSHGLPGMELINLDLETVNDDFEIAAYEQDGQFTFYILNNSMTPQDIPVDLTEILPDFQGATGVQVGYDSETSDGRIYSPTERSMIDAQAVMIEGQPYYINEHDTGAVLTDHIFNMPEFNVTLNPFEIIEIKAW